MFLVVPLPRESFENIKIRTVSTVRHTLRVLTIEDEIIAITSDRLCSHVSRTGIPTFDLATVVSLGDVLVQPYWFVSLVPLSRGTRVERRPGREWPSVAL